jgi:hypothetical protein
LYRDYADIFLRPDLPLVNFRTQHLQILLDFGANKPVVNPDTIFLPSGRTAVRPPSAVSNN